VPGPEHFYSSHENASGDDTSWNLRRTRRGGYRSRVYFAIQTMRSTTLLGLAPAAAIQVALGGDTINATLYDKLNFDFIQQSIKEGKGLSCRTLAANAVRLQLHALAYDLGNFLRTLATPEPIKDWSLTRLKEKLI
jgi:hypothetical protein